MFPEATDIISIAAIEIVYQRKPGIHLQIPFWIHLRSQPARPGIGYICWQSRFVSNNITSLVS